MTGLCGKQYGQYTLLAKISFILWEVSRYGQGGFFRSFPYHDVGIFLVQWVLCLGRLEISPPPEFPSNFLCSFFSLEKLGIGVFIGRLRKGNVFTRVCHSVHMGRERGDVHATHTPATHSPTTHTPCHKHPLHACPLMPCILPCHVCPPCHACPHDMVNDQAVRILLEISLVPKCFTEFSQFSDKNICHYSKRAQTCHLQCKRLICYHSASKTQVAERIFKFSPIHASVICQIR